MSITSVVYVPEGIAMAADSRLTGNKTVNNITDRFTISDNSQKIFLLKKFNIGISSCGDASINGKTIADFLRLFEIEQIVSEDNVHTITTKLHNHLKTSTASDLTSFYISGYVGDDAFVYKVTKIESICQRGGTNYGAGWDGQTEAVSKLLIGNNPTLFEWNFMQLKDGIDLAEFLIELTIKYQRFEDRIATCGGAIDILVITKDNAQFIKHKIFNP